MIEAMNLCSIANTVGTAWLRSELQSGTNATLGKKDIVFPQGVSSTGGLWSDDSLHCAISPPQLIQRIWFSDPRIKNDPSQSVALLLSISPTTLPPPSSLLLSTLLLSSPVFPPSVRLIPRRRAPLPPPPSSSPLSLLLSI